MAKPKSTITIKTETEQVLYQLYNEEKHLREKLECLVNELQIKVENLQQQLRKAEEGNKKEACVKPGVSKEVPSEVQYETDDEELARETEWIRQESRKKRKRNLTPSPSQQVEPNKKVPEKPKEKKALLPPPIVVEGIKNFQKFYDFLSDSIPSESFTIKMMKGDMAKINTKSENSYKATTKLLVDNKNHWHSYENKQDRPIRVMAKNLHHTYVPGRIIEDLKAKGFKITEAVNKLSWRTKEPLNMFMLSFQKEEDINNIYNISSILGCKVEIQPIKTSKLIPQCKKCQAYGHTQKYCSKEPRCVKCTGKHLTRDCPKPADAKPKCIHCGEPHPANYRGCIVAKELQNMKNKVMKSSKNTIKTPDTNRPKKIINSQSIKKDVTYSQMAKAGQMQIQPQVLSQSQQKPQSQEYNIEDKINKILNFMTSFDNRLKKLEHSTKTAILPNTKQ